MKPEVFISYSWPKVTGRGKSLEGLINNIQTQLEKNNFRVVIDKKDVKYKDNIKNFENRLAQGDKIILLINDEFLRSKHCMYELLKIKENGNINERIFPIILSDAQIYEPKGSIIYAKYWEGEAKKLSVIKKTLKNTKNLSGVNSTIQNFKDFRKIIDEMIQLFGNMHSIKIADSLEINMDELINALKDEKIEISQTDEQDFGKRLFEVRGFFEASINIIKQEIKYQGHLENDILIRAQNWYKKCQEQTFQIGVMAMVKSGKSSFLNALLGNEFLPMSNVPETATHVKILHSNGHEPYLEINSKEKISGVSEISSFLKEKNKKYRYKGAKKLEDIKLHAGIIALNNLRMSKIKFEILDTPGFGEVLHEEIVGKNIEQSNTELLDGISVVIYLLDYTKLKTEQESEILSKFASRPDILEKIQDRLFLVINKVDEQDRNSLTAEQTIDYVYSLVKHEIPKITKNQIFYLSAKDALLSRLILSNAASPEAKSDFEKMAFRYNVPKEDYKYTQTAKEMLKSSNINVIEAKLIDFIYQQRGRIFLETLLDNLKRILEEFKNKFILTATGTLNAKIVEIEALEEKIKEAKEKQESIQNDADKFEHEIKSWINTEFNNFEKKIVSNIEDLFNSEKAETKRRHFGIFPSSWVAHIQKRIPLIFSQIDATSRTQTLESVTSLNKEIIIQLNNEFLSFKISLEQRIFGKQKFLLDSLEDTINSLARKFENTVGKSLNVKLSSIELHLTNVADFDTIKAEADLTIDRFVKIQTSVKNIPVEKQVYVDGKWCRKGHYEMQQDWEKRLVKEYHVSKDSLELFWRDSMQKKCNEAKAIANDFIQEQIRKQIKNARKSFDDYVEDYLNIIQFNKAKLNSGNTESVKNRINDLIKLDESISSIIGRIESGSKNDNSVL